VGSHSLQGLTCRDAGIVGTVSTPQFLDGLRTVLSKTADIVGQISANSVWSPQPGSLGDAELKNNEFGPQGAWGELPVRTAYEVARMGVEAAAEYARALEVMLTVGRPSLVPETLARGSLEMAAATSWLLQEDIGPRRRVCRLQLVRMKSAIELERAVNELGVSNADAAYGETPDQVRATSQALGLAPFAGPGASTCESETWPGYTKRAKALLDDWGDKGAYTLYSGTAHAELYALWRSFSQIGATPPGRQPTFGLVQDPTGLHRATHVVLLAMIAPLERASFLFGWHGDSPPGADLSSTIDRVNLDMDRLLPRPI